MSMNFKQSLTPILLRRTFGRLRRFHGHFVSALVLSFSVWLPAQANGEAAFWQALQEGGKVVLIRHAIVDREFGNPFVLDDSCFTEVNLNEKGQLQAALIGRWFREKAILVEAVWASPHCRTRETAQLAFNQFQIKPELRLIRALPETQAEANLKQVRLLISQYKGQGNLVMVTHRPNIGELIYQRLAPGEMAVLEPLAEEPGEVAFDVVARLRVDIPN